MHRIPGYKIREMRQYIRNHRDVNIQDLRDTFIDADEIVVGLLEDGSIFRRRDFITACAHPISSA